MEKELIILGFAVTDPFNLKRLRLAWDQEAKMIKGKRVLGRGKLETKEILSQDLGGEVFLIDIENGPISILGKIKVPTPMGLYYDSLSKTLFTGSDHWVYQIQKGVASKWVGNKYFNCIHGISGTSRGGILITATGIDAVLEMDIISKRPLYNWFATENGYNLQPGGEERFIDHSLNYQMIEFSTLEHTTHVNSSIEYSDNEILATFFHQGELVKIDKKSGQVQVVLSELLNPHSIRRAKSGFIVSDTNNKRIVRLDNQLNFVGEILGEFEWIQDAIELNSGNIVVADSNHGRIVLISSKGEVLNEFNYGTDNMRIGSLAKIEVKEAGNIF